ncbi:DMT family transporter [Weeksellaceae bacterium TAE3-ERU29]|nr:DMT family transporter [Weeksellaceae bacterium TAE3-ERU29]
MKAQFRLHFLVLLWGFTGVLGKLITISALPLVFFRILFAFIGVGLFLYLKKVPLKETRKNILKLLGIGSVIGLHWVLFFWAIKISNVSVALSTLSTGALFTAFLEPLFFKRRINITEIIPATIVIICLYFIFNASPNYILGIIMGISCSFLSALFSVLNAKVHKEFIPSKMIFYELMGGIIFVFLVLLFSGNTTELTNVTTIDFFWIGVLGFGLTAFPMVESTRLLKYLSPFSMLLAINLEPVYGIILAYFIFGKSEQMTPTFYIASLIMLLVIASYELIKAIKKKQKKEILLNELNQ